MRAMRVMYEAIDVAAWLSRKYILKDSMKLSAFDRSLSKIAGRDPINFTSGAAPGCAAACPGCGAPPPPPPAGGFPPGGPPPPLPPEGAPPGGPPPEVDCFMIFESFEAVTWAVGPVVTAAVVCVVVIVAIDFLMGEVFNSSGIADSLLRVSSSCSISSSDELLDVVDSCCSSFSTGGICC